MTDAQLLLKKISNGTTVVLSGVILVGRKPPATVLLTEGQPSRRHAQLTVSAEGVTIEDLGSANGTFVNDRRIDAKVLLKGGDRVRFDIEEYQFLVQAPADADRTLMRPSPAPAIAAAGPSADAQPLQSRAVPEKIVAEPAPPARRPGAWADPASSKTVFFDPKEILKDIPAAVRRPSSIGSDDAPYLLVCSGASEGMEIRLTRAREGQQEWSVGSDPGREVRLSDSGVSGLHARIVNEGERWKVVDQMSANGTYVNGKRSPISYLATGDRLRFGPVECMLQLPRRRVATASGATTGTMRKHKSSLVVAVSFVLTAILLLVAYLLLK